MTAVVILAVVMVNGAALYMAHRAGSATETLPWSQTRRVMVAIDVAFVTGVAVLGASL